MTTIHEWQPGMFERPCGGCTMCCKIPGIPEIGKPPHQWCEHCDRGKGCRIYEQRPAPCRAFMCLWKVMPDFPEDLRPDRCKTIWTMSEDGRVAVAVTAYPERWQHDRDQQQLAASFRRHGREVRAVAARL